MCVWAIPVLVSRPVFVLFVVSLPQLPPLSLSFPPRPPTAPPPSSRCRKLLALLPEEEQKEVGAWVAGMSLFYALVLFGFFFCGEAQLEC